MASWPYAQVPHLHHLHDHPDFAGDVPLRCRPQCVGFRLSVPGGRTRFLADKLPSEIWPDLRDIFQCVASLSFVGTSRTVSLALEWRASVAGWNRHHGVLSGGGLPAYGLWTGVF